jgi:hypothetical protein
MRSIRTTSNHSQHRGHSKRLSLHRLSPTTMSAFPRLSTTSIGRNKDAPRVWLEGLYLLQAGFAPTRRVQVEFTRRKVTIRLSPNGPRIVSSKQKRNAQIPVLDLNSSALAETFGTISTLQVCITEGQIILTPTQTEELRANRCRNGYGFGHKVNFVGHKVKAVGHKLLLLTDIN